MNRSHITRLATLLASVLVVMSCDSAPTELPPLGGGTGGGVAPTPPTPPTTPGTTGDGAAPVIAIDTPVVTTPSAVFNLSDSILVAFRVRDNQTGVRSVVLEGISYRGSRDLGTETVVQRYQRVVIPSVQGGGGISEFPAGTAVGRDTLIRRFLIPIVGDTAQDSVVIRVTALDYSGLSSTATRTVRLASGPRVAIVSPVTNDSVLARTQLTVRVQASQPEGVSRVVVRFRGDTSWSAAARAAFDGDVTVTGTNEANFNGTVTRPVPEGVPGRSRITITAEAVDVNRVSGFSAPTVVRVQQTAPDVPLVRQTVGTRLEITDSVRITASGNGIVQLGFVVSGEGGQEIRRFSTTPSTGADRDRTPRDTVLSLNLPTIAQGQKITIISFAVDRDGRTGYSVPASVSRAESVEASAFRDTATVVFGVTYRLPGDGVAGDLAVDPSTGNVFVSNTNRNRLELWRPGSSGFSNSVPVGSAPWGLTVSATNPDELLVANSGGTNISVVNIAAGSPAETRRILTRNTVAYTITQVRDPATGKIRVQVSAPVSYSDRPQYIAQSQTGRIFYSTRPTPSAPQGTLRYLDPTQARPDPRQIWQYGTGTATLGQYAVLNVDYATVIPSPADSPDSDTLVICDHPTGTDIVTNVENPRNDPYCKRSTRLIEDEILPALRADGSDVVAVYQLDLPSLALADTNFVTWSGDRRWIAFGEGATGNDAARAILAFDPSGTPDGATYFSRGIDVRDLVENASEPVFGLALDSTGSMLAVHGRQSHFSSVTQALHLRLQGRVDTFDAGAGIAFHPSAIVSPDAPGSAPDTRLAFVASANGTIEIVDAYYFTSRGRVLVRDPLYGPLRAGLPTAAERAAGIAVKLYGLTARGMVVINVNNSDIRPIQ